MFICMCLCMYIYLPLWLSYIFSCLPLTASSVCFVFGYLFALSLFLSHALANRNGNSQTSLIRSYFFHIDIRHSQIKREKMYV